jgi:hypothetical protein
VAELIQFFVRHVPGAGRTQIVKFLYLADLEARRYLGKPLTSLDYIWYDFGPFDSEILAELDQLSSRGVIQGEPVLYPDGKAGYRYLPGDSVGADALSREEAAIADYVVCTYGNTRLRPLLEEVVYQTRPMLDAKQRGAFGGRLDMGLVDNERRFPGVELGTVLRAIEDVDSGRGRPLREVRANAGR